MLVRTQARKLNRQQHNKKGWYFSNVPSIFFENIEELSPKHDLEKDLVKMNKTD